MAELTQIILSEVEGENIDATDLGIELKRGKGLFNRRKIMDVFGTVRTATDKKAVMRVAERHAGDNYDVEDNLKVKVQ